MDTFLAGLVLGLAIGLLVAPAVRWALTVREWRRASREVGLADEVLRLMDEGHRPEPLHDRLS